MKIIHILICSLCLLASALIGCQNFVKVNAPRTELVTSRVFSSDNTANSAMLAIYSQMSNNEGYFIPLFTGLSGDELTNYSTTPDIVSFYTNSLNAFNGSLQTEWDNAYSYIYQANAVIDGLQRSNGVSPAVKQQLTGESEFLRAFWHFYLTNLFGDVPLITTTAYNVNALAARTPQIDVFKQVIADLADAQKKLSDNYVDADGLTTTVQKVRPNFYAATAMLARVYLFTQNWDSAIIEATQVINNTSYSLDTLNGVFLANSNEAIWQLEPVASGFNTLEGYSFILLGGPQTGNTNCSTISPQLLGSFEPGDGRRINWIDSISTGGSPYYFPYKYKVYQSDNVTEYEMVLRLGEQYLIRAEAEAQSNLLTDAATDLNKIRIRAGLGAYSPTILSAMLSTILHERQVELFTEWGHRWLDLKRTDSINNIMPTVALSKGTSWSTNWQLYPIPQSERTNDPSLTQNQGY